MACNSKNNYKQILLYYQFLQLESILRSKQSLSKINQHFCSPTKLKGSAILIFHLAMIIHSFSSSNLIMDFEIN
jgi:hypothetical protein